MTTHKTPREQDLAAKLSTALAEADALRTLHGSEDPATWPAGASERYSRLIKHAERLDDELTALSERGAKIAAIRAAVDGGGPNVRLESGFGVSGDSGGGFGGSLIASNGANRTRAWAGLDRSGSVDNWGAEEMRSRALIACAEMDGLEPASRTKLTEMVEKDGTSASGRFVLALGAPAYRTAFDRWLKSPETAHLGMTVDEGAAWRDVDAARTAMGETGASALLPLVLDPTVMLTNAGTAGDVRSYATVRTTTTNQWRGINSPGVTAEFKTEGSEAADGSPTVSAVDIPIYFADASIKLSYEIEQDTDISGQLAAMIADARAQQENRVFVLGAGTTEPFGAVTRVAATTASRVAPTTASTFTTASYADVFKVRDALPVRHRRERSAWVSNIATQSIVQQVGVANAGLGAFWSNLGEAPGGTLLGFPSLEASTMDTVGASKVILALVNWTKYVIVDRLGTSVIRTNVLGANGRSTGQWEYFAAWRYGGDLTNVDAGRALKL